MLSFLSAMLRQHVGARLVAECSRSGLSAITDAVMYGAPYDVTPYLREAQFDFPLLAIYRMTARYPEATASWTRDEGEWGVDYVLPPLSASQAERIVPILRAVGVVIENRTRQGWDPSYRGGEKIVNTAAIDAIGLMSGTYGLFRAVDGTDLSFWGFRGILAVSERTSPVAGAFPVFAGADVEVDLSVQGQADLAHVADFKSDVP